MHLLLLRHSASSGDVLGCSTFNWEIRGIQSVEASDIRKHPTLHRTSLYNKYQIVQIIHDVIVRDLDLVGMSRSIGRITRYTGAYL